MRTAIVKSIAYVLFVFIPIAMFGQVATGAQPFGSFGGRRFDTINLGSLNVHFSLPVAHKAGRGLPFIYDISYDSSLWSPVTSGGVTTWQPATGWGWQSTTSHTGQITNTSSSYYCYGSNGYPIGHVQTISNWKYIDAFGAIHAFGGQIISSTCPGVGSVSSFTSAASDGSGLTMNIGVSGQHQIVTKDGIGIDPGTSGVIVDTNGNQISLASGVITDTLGTSALTITGSGSASSPTVYSYTNPSNTSSSYTLSYANHQVGTNFGCGYTEYTNNSVDLPDRLTLPDQTYYSFTYEPTPGRAGYVTGRIASVRLPTGATITYSYSGGNNGIICADGSTAGLSRTTPDSGNPWTYTRTGSGAAWTTTSTSPATDKTVISFQSVTSNGTVTYYETERDVYTGPSSLLATILTCYNGSALPCNSTAVSLPILRRTVLTELPNSTGQQSKVDTYLNGYGLPTEVDEYDFGSGTVGALVRKVLTSYGSYSGGSCVALGNGIAGVPCQVTIQDSGGNTKAQTSYTYTATTTATSGTPQHGSISGDRGNVGTIAYLTGPTTLTKSFTYFDTGNVQTSTDVNGAQTTYVYSSAVNPYNSSYTASCGNSFPTTLSEPLGLSRSVQWNCTGGVTGSTTDENSQTTSYGYNDANYWRTTSTTDPLSNATSTSYTTTSLENTLNFNAGSSTVDTLATVDGLGRIHVSQKRQSPGSLNFDSMEIDYDAAGRQSRTTQPYVGTAGQTNSTAPAVSTTYDGLNRVTQTTDAGGGSTSYTYTKNDAFVSINGQPTGESAKRRQLEYDGLGRLTSVCEITGASGSGQCSQTTVQTGYWTKYTYDVLDNLTGVTQNAQDVPQYRSYVYDDLGRLTQETNPESGTTSYTFDSDGTCGTFSGDLVKRVDAVGNITCYHYDALHRVTSITYPSGLYAAVTPEKHFVYDSAIVNGVTMANAKNRLAEAYTGTSKTTDLGFSYTVRGELSDAYESTPNSGGYYHVTRSYWANGGPNQLYGIPGVPTISYGADSEGRPSLVSASSGQNPVTSVAYNVASIPTAITFGSSDSDSFQFDSNTNRMTQFQHSVNGSSLTGNVTWNPNWTLNQLAITDAFNSSNSQTCNYSHDDLARVMNVSCGATWAQTFGFDAYGNINKSGSISFAATYNNGTNRLTNMSSSYDSDGNLTGISSDAVYSYSWDVEGKPVSITRSGSAVNLTYDAFGRMVEQNRGGSYTQVLYGPGGGKVAVMTGQSVLEAFVPLPSGAQAVYNSSGLEYYRHSDWLGSSRLASTPSRTVYYDGAYAPFGETYSEIGTSDHDFTGQNQDTQTGIYDFLFREYHPVSGRWISPDPAGMAATDLTNPQSLNRYAYVLGNPLNAIDPLGLDPPSCQTAACWKQYAATIEQNWRNFATQFIGNAPRGPMNCNVDGVNSFCDSAIAMINSGAATVVPYAGNWTAIQLPDHKSADCLVDSGSGMIWCATSVSFGMAVSGPPNDPTSIFRKWATRGAPPTNQPRVKGPTWPNDPDPVLNPPKQITDIPKGKAVFLKLLEFINSLPKMGSYLFTIDPCTLQPALQCGPFAPPPNQL